MLSALSEPSGVPSSSGGRDVLLVVYITGGLVLVAIFMVCIIVVLVIVVLLCNKSATSKIVSVVSVATDEPKTRTKKEKQDQRTLVAQKIKQDSRGKKNGSTQIIAKEGEKIVRRKRSLHKMTESTRKPRYSSRTHRSRHSSASSTFSLTREIHDSDTTSASSTSKTSVASAYSQYSETGDTDSECASVEDEDVRSGSFRREVNIEFEDEEFAVPIRESYGRMHPRQLRATQSLSNLRATTHLLRFVRRRTVAVSSGEEIEVQRVQGLPTGAVKTKKKYMSNPAVSSVFKDVKRRSEWEY